MSRVDATAPVTPSAQPTSNSVENLDLDVFLDLLLAELQNQDPLDPQDTSEMINSISQIREISTNDRLSETLDSVLLGQNVATATGLIGTEVEGLTDDGRRVVGAVQQVTINEGEPSLEVAVGTSASAADAEGDIAPGAYTYEIVWETDDGVFSVPIQVDTDTLGDDFQGAIRLENLPTLDAGVVRKVYRSDGSGPPRLVGTLPNGSIAAFTDQKSTAQLDDETVPEVRTPLLYADSVDLRLSNVGFVRTTN